MMAVIVMPSDAPAVKIDNIRAYGGEVVLYDRMTEDREAIGRALSEERGAAYVHAFADPWVIEGQGSAGIEIAQQLGRQPGRIGRADVRAQGKRDVGCGGHTVVKVAGIALHRQQHREERQTPRVSQRQGRVLWPVHLAHRTHRQ